jgi:hypothetical protein
MPLTLGDCGSNWRFGSSLYELGVIIGRNYALAYILGVFLKGEYNVDGVSSI